jgi:5-methyltetrahydropteroyltriglutamate--homocysteine methyltransferase
MQRSTDRILTTHAGSIPRGEPLGALLIDQEQGKPVDQARLDELADARVAHVLAKEAEVGIDSANDGEQARVGFQTYIPLRMDGFGGVSKRPFGKEFIEFAQFTQRMLARIPNHSKVFDAPEAIGELKYRDTSAIDAEIARYKKLSAPMQAKFSEFFMNAPSPGIIATTMLNAHYNSHQAYLDAIARELHVEYARVVDAGFVLQIDAPDLAMERVLLYQDLSDAEFAKLVEQHVAAVNRGLQGLPPDRVRLHVCWGNWEGPHNYDVAWSRIRQSAAAARDRGAAQAQIARPHAAGPRRDRQQEQFRRAPRSGGATHRGGRGGGRRPRTGHRRCRLRLRNFRRLGVGDRGCRVGQAQGAARRRRYRVSAAVGKAELGQSRTIRDLFGR